MYSAFSERSRGVRYLLYDAWTFLRGQPLKFFGEPSRAVGRDVRSHARVSYSEALAKDPARPLRAPTCPTQTAIALSQSGLDVLACVQAAARGRGAVTMPRRSSRPARRGWRFGNAFASTRAERTKGSYPVRPRLPVGRWSPPRRPSTDVRISCIASPCSWQMRDSVTPSTSPISRKLCSSW